MNLFLFPHQDDEVPVFHEIDSLVQKGVPLSIWFLTSGQVSAESHTQRNKESLRVLEKLGVKPSEVHFLGGEFGVADGKLHLHLEKLQGKIQQLMKGMPINAVYMPAWEGGHQDHDAAHLLGVSLATHWQCVQNSRQFPFYHGKGLKSILFRALSPLPGNGPVYVEKIGIRKRIDYLRNILTYRSQTMTWVGLGPFFALHYLTKGTQILQGISSQRVTEKPHKGLMFYERRKFCTFEQFQVETQKFTCEYLSKVAQSKPKIAAEFHAEGNQCLPKDGLNNSQPNGVASR